MLGIAFLSVCDICWYNAVPNTCTMYNCKYLHHVQATKNICAIHIHLRNVSKHNRIIICNIFI